MGVTSVCSVTVLSVSDEDVVGADSVDSVDPLASVSEDSVAPSVAPLSVLPGVSVV